ncbi:MAG TPA: hypothetical protein VK101_10240, partial [Limnochordia bacterium]|nr:hypothetical protein [Limnochordia bacterium]
MGNILWQHVSERVEKALAKLGVEEFDVAGTIEVPPDPSLGDYAFPCFQLARILRKAPDRIAQELAEKLGPDGLIERVDVVKAYVNFFLNRPATCERV